jgi:tetratricopeptide (TPR) repeat protein
LAINPHHVGTLNNKGLAVDHLGDHTGAIEYYDKVLAIDPHNVIALTNKGWAFDGLGNYTGAIEYYDKVLAIDPHNVGTLNGSIGERWFQARKEFEHLTQINQLHLWTRH